MNEEEPQEESKTSGSEITMSVRSFHGIQIDDSRDSKLTNFGKETLADRYRLEGESNQELFARVAKYFSDDLAHAQRLYDYISNLWFMPATPVLSNGGTDRGLPISCLTGDMLINTPAGAKQIKDIVIGDLVLTHTGSWKPVTATSSRMSDDVYEMVIDRRRTKIRITGNHPVLTQHGWVRVDELVVGSGGKKRHLSHRVAINNQIKMIEDNTSICSFTMNADLAWAIGVWLAEGSVMRQSSGNVSGLRITMNVNEESYVQKWLDIMSSTFGGSVKAYISTVERNETTHQWINGYICGSELASKFVAEFGCGFAEKHGSSWAMNLSRGERLALLEGFLLGDGCEHETNGYEYNTVVCANPSLISFFYNIAISLDYHVSLRLDKPAPKGSSVEKVSELRVFRNQFHPRYKLDESDDNAVRFAAISRLEKIDGTHEVFDIQVADDASFSVAGVVVHNCFLNEVPDSLDGIWDSYRENMRLASQGGGIGTFWGNLRSIGEEVGRAGQTSGIIPFIKAMDSQTLAVSQGSLRRGSAAVYLQIDHPEVEEFLQMRKPSGGDPNRKCLNLHHGLCITDEFMNAVRDNLQWEFRSPKTGEVRSSIPAQQLWARILEYRLETGEPYLLFIDAVNRDIPEWHKMAGLEVKTSNLCVEITLPTNRERTAVCCLSSLNLETYPEWRGNRRFVIDVMRFLDNVLSDFINRAETTPKFKELLRAAFSARQERSVGLGVMGFHSYLQSKSIAFESELARTENEEIFSFIESCATEASALLATEKGPCPDAAEYGFNERFSNKTAVAPTASISIICGGASPGIEPVAANAYTHKTLSGSFLVKNPYLETILREHGQNTDETWASIIANAGSIQHLDFLDDHIKNVFKTAYELDQTWVVRHAADRTPYIDQSSSVNLFFQPDVDKTKLLQVHTDAWKWGMKSLYYCRTQSIKQAHSVSQKVERKKIVQDVVEEEKPSIITESWTAPTEELPLAAASDDEKYFTCEACQ